MRPSRRAPDRGMTHGSWRGLEGSGGLDLRLSGDPAEATTRVLAACWAGAGAGAVEGVWRLTLSGRIGGLASVLLASQAERDLAVALRCPVDACGESFAAPVPLATLAALGEEAEAEPVVTAALGNGLGVRLRRPTGEDLRRWRSAGWSDAGEAEREVARSLVVQASTGEVDGDAVAAGLSDRMAEVDPLPAFRLVTTCPACGGEVERELDLEAVLLERLTTRQQATLREVHRLASRYGWSEAEVLAVPAWRRAQYLTLIDAGAGW